MIQLSSLQIQLLNLLSDGHCYSGNLLGDHLGISRTAIWKQIKQLNKLGITVTSLSKGYQLVNPIQLLTIEKITNYLTQLHFVNPINFHLFTSIDSTNNFLKSLTYSNNVSVCLAEKQTQGRGRLGRQWVSPFGVNIYFSSRWHFNCCLSKLSGLSLVVSLSLHTCLTKFGIPDLLVKWPNDLIWHDQKLGGILIEVIAETNGLIQVIIGIGLNVNMLTSSDEKPENNWCSLEKITGNLWDRNQLIANLLCSLTEYITIFIEQGFQPFRQEWDNIDYLRGHYISLSHPTGLKFGFATGVSEQGHLLLTEETGEKQALSAGEVSLVRKVKACLPQA